MESKRMSLAHAEPKRRQYRQKIADPSQRIPLEEYHRRAQDAEDETAEAAGKWSNQAVLGRLVRSAAAIAIIERNPGPATLCGFWPNSRPEWPEEVAENAGLTLTRQGHVRPEEIDLAEEAAGWVLAYVTCSQAREYLSAYIRARTFGLQISVICKELGTSRMSFGTHKARALTVIAAGLNTSGVMLRR